MTSMFDACHANPARPVPAPCALQQHPGFAAALRACGQSPLVLDGPQPLVVLRRRFFSKLPVAMLARARTTSPDRLAEQLAGVGLHRTPIILSPDHPAPALADLGAAPLMSPATLAEIDLRPPLATRRAALHQKWRNRLRAAEALERANTLRVTCEPLPPDPSHWLLTADVAQQKQRGYRGWPPALTPAYVRENPGQARLFTAFQGRDPLAAMLFLRHGTGATYHIGHTTPRGRQVSAHTLLLWQAATWLAARGHTRLDLGLINTETAPGLARFKLGAGARPRRLGGTWLWWLPLRRTLRPLARLDRGLMAPPSF